MSRNAVFASGITWLMALALPAAFAQSPAPPGRSVGSDVRRIESPDATAADIAQVVADDSAFAFDFYHALLKPVAGESQPANLVYSPYSISVALAMTYAGARGETAEQMAKAMHFTLPPERLHPAVNALDLQFAAAPADKKDDAAFRLYIVNRLWGQEGYPFLAEFLDLNAKQYGAGLITLDFTHQPEEARRVINTWVSEQTQTRIQELLPPRSIVPLTRLVLTNAVYFKAQWATPFDKRETKNGPFHLIDGAEVPVAMMRQETTYRYGAEDGVQAVELPYSHVNRMAMLLIVPDAGHFADFESHWSTAALNGIVAGLRPRYVSLQMPKFTITMPQALKLKSILSDLGMPLAFTDAADFSGMTGKHDLFIDNVYHKAFMLVDESGTEAAAATAVVMKTKGAPLSSARLTIDRPFMLVIRDTRNGAVLFMGRVLDPRG